MKFGRHLLTKTETTGLRPFEACCQKYSVYWNCVTEPLRVNIRCWACADKVAGKQISVMRRTIVAKIFVRTIEWEVQNKSYLWLVGMCLSPRLKTITSCAISYHFYKISRKIKYSLGLVAPSGRIFLASGKMREDEVSVGSEAQAALVYIIRPTKSDPGSSTDAMRWTQADEHNPGSLNK